MLHEASLRDLNHEKTQEKPTGFILRCVYFGKVVDVTDIPFWAWKKPGLRLTCGRLLSTGLKAPGQGWLIDEATGDLESPDPQVWRHRFPGGRTAIEIGLGEWRDPNDLTGNEESIRRVLGERLENAGYPFSLEESRDPKGRLRLDLVYGLEAPPLLLPFMERITDSLCLLQNFEALRLLDEARWFFLEEAIPPPEAWVGEPIRSMRRVSWPEIPAILQAELDREDQEDLELAERSLAPAG